MDRTSTRFLVKLCRLADQHHFIITATTNGTHNLHSLHYLGRAIDVSVHGKTDAEIAAFVAACHEQGFRVLDERHRLPGEAVWHGPHLHIEDREGM